MVLASPEPQLPSPPPHLGWLPGPWRNQTRGPRYRARVEASRRGGPCSPFIALPLSGHLYNGCAPRTGDTRQTPPGSYLGPRFCRRCRHNWNPPRMELREKFTAGRTPWQPVQVGGRGARGEDRWMAASCLQRRGLWLMVRFGSEDRL